MNLPLHVVLLKNTALSPSESLHAGNDFINPLWSPEESHLFPLELQTSCNNKGATVSFYAHSRSIQA